MGTLRRPDWTEPMGIGLWGLGYRPRNNQGLVWLSKEAILSNDDPDRLWHLILTHDRRRDKRLEQCMASQVNSRSLLERQKLGKDDLLCVEGKNLFELLHSLEQQPPPNGCEGENSSTTNGQGRR